VRYINNNQLKRN